MKEVIIIRKLFKYILCITPWFLSCIIKVNYKFYNNLNLPFFTPTLPFLKVLWIITYISISINIYILTTSYKSNDLRKYYKILIINYISNQSSAFIFFTLKNLFLSFISCLLTFITTLYLYEESTFLDEKSTKYLNPYVLLSLFSTVLSLTIYLTNIR